MYELFFPNALGSIRRLADIARSHSMKQQFGLLKIEINGFVF